MFNEFKEIQTLFGEFPALVRDETKMKEFFELNEQLNFFLKKEKTLKLPDEQKNMDLQIEEKEFEKIKNFYPENTYFMSSFPELYKQEIRSYNKINFNLQLEEVIIFIYKN